MTRRLYYHDSFLREFEARVVRVEPHAEGRVRVFLDQTGFYPASGGQPADRGTLNDMPVEDVIETEGGDIAHVAERAPAVETVRGCIDWERRFDHMQQHSGQHLLSAAFVRLFNWATVSFHLGRDLSTIDLAAPALGARQLRAAEELANQVIFEDRPVRIRFGAAEELGGEARKQAERAGELRWIDIEDFDRCPCGGTHVSRTGQVGLLLVRGQEKEKGNVRLEFACGGRALRAARVDYDTLAEAARLLTTGPAELPNVLRKQFEERRAGERALSDLRARLIEYEARDWLRASEEKAGRRVIVKLVEGADAGYLRELAARLVSEPGVQALLATRQEPAAVVFAQTPGLGADMSALLREALGKLGGKGGGSRDFAQGSAPNPTRVEASLQQAAAALRQA